MNTKTIAMTTRNTKFILQLVFVAIFWILCLTAGNLIIDDAYITFQYAKNFAAFGKPWYNLDPVFQGNGQTSLLWMWILALLRVFGLKQEIFFLWLNIGFGSFLIIKLIHFLEFNLGKWIQNVFKCFLICFFVLWLFVNSIHGLETVLASFILYFFFKNWDKTNNYVALLLPLIRPEYILFQFFWVVNTQFFSSQFYQRILIALLGVVIYGWYYFVFFDYYILLPFLYKSEFRIYTQQQFFVYGGLLLVFLPAFISLFNKKKFLLLIAINILFFYYTFNVQSYSSGIFTRYYFPLMVIYLVIPIESVRYKFCNTFAQLSFKILMVFVILRMVDLSGNFLQQKKQIAFENIDYYKSYQNLINLLKPSDKVTINDAGYTAYFSTETCYDGVGLNDATIMLARKNKDHVAYRNYIIKKKINYVTVGSLHPNEFTARSEPEKFLYESLYLKNHQPYRVFAMDKGYYLFVYYFENGYHN